MKIFLWAGIDQNNMRCKGEIDAQSPNDAKTKLLQENIIALKIRLKPTIVISLFNKKITHKLIQSFILQLATLINANMPLLTCLNMIKDNYKHKNMRKLLVSISRDIERGETLAHTLKKHHHNFNSLICNLIDVGEQSGTLAIMLQQAANYLEKVSALNRKIKKALIYPITVLTVAIAVTTILLIFVIPQLAAMYASFNATLPIYTQLIIRLSTHLIHSWKLIGTTIIVIIITIKLLDKHTRWFHDFLDIIILKLPIFGKLIAKAIIIRIFTSLAITLRAGMPLNNTLQLAANTASNSIYRKTLLNSCKQIADGHTFSSSLSPNLFPAQLLQLIAISEQSGTLTEMLSKISEQYESELNITIDNLNNLLEPIIMVILGLIIGGLIVGMYLPIFKLGTVL